MITAGASRTQVRESISLTKTHCCFPSCMSKGLFLLHCEQTCNSQCTGTSCQLSHACKSKKRKEFGEHCWRFCASVLIRSKRALGVKKKKKHTHTYLELRWDGFFGWKWSDRCPLFPFMGTYKHHPPVFCPPETKTTFLVMYWTAVFHFINSPPVHNSCVQDLEILTCVLLWLSNTSCFCLPR